MSHVMTHRQVESYRMVLEKWDSGGGELGFVLAFEVAAIAFRNSVIQLATVHGFQADISSF